MSLRTTMIAIATLGLFATALGAPLASADTEVPAYPEETDCPQVHLFHEEIGPVTLDGSDGCVSVVVEETDCEPGELDPADETEAQACLEDLAGYASDEAAVDAKFPPTVCIYPFGCN